jgi:hypothetical protein
MDIALLGTALDYLLLACFSKALWWAASGEQPRSHRRIDGLWSFKCQDSRPWGAVRQSRDYRATQWPRRKKLDREAFHGWHDTCYPVQASYPRPVAPCRNAERQPSSWEIRRQLVGRLLLDRTRYSLSGAAQVVSMMRRIGVFENGRKLRASSSIIPDAGCMTCIMPGAS